MKIEYRNLPITATYSPVTKDLQIRLIADNLVGKVVDSAISVEIPLDLREKLDNLIANEIKKFEAYLKEKVEWK